MPSKKNNKTEVKIVMTHGGQVIVANVTETSNAYTLERPAVLVPSSDGTGSLMLLPWVPYANEQTEGAVTLVKSYIVSCLTPVDACLDEYNRIGQEGDLTEMETEEEKDASTTTPPTGASNTSSGISTIDG